MLVQQAKQGVRPLFFRLLFVDFVTLQAVLKRVMEHEYASWAVCVEHVRGEAVNAFLANGTPSQRGFTMTELITVMVIIGVLAAMVAPRFFDRNTFDSRGFYDQTISTLRYAQKTAISQHRLVCVAFTPNSITLTQVASGSTCPGTSPANNLANPNGQATNYSVVGNQAQFSNPANDAIPFTPMAFNFDALGRPRDTAGALLTAQQVIKVRSYITLIRVEMETGYVY